MASTTWTSSRTTRRRLSRASPGRRRALHLQLGADLFQATLGDVPQTPTLERRSDQQLELLEANRRPSVPSSCGSWAGPIGQSDPPPADGPAQLRATGEPPTDWPGRPGARGAPHSRARLTALDQCRDDRLVEAVAHRSLGDRHVVPGGQSGAQSGVVLRAVGDDEEAADRGRDLEVLDRIPHRDQSPPGRSRGRGHGRRRRSPC